jgi:hypothetical protein
VREYVKKQGLGITPEQLDRLVPAFEATWAAIEKRGGLGSANERSALRDRVAKAVVDQVISAGLSDRDEVVAAVVRQVLPGGAGREK